MHSLEQRGNPSHRDEEDSEDSDDPEAETWYYKGELVAQNCKFWVQPFAHGASSSVNKESHKGTEATWDHYLHISPHTSHFMEAVFSMVRKIKGKQLGDLVEDLNVNLAVWSMFMNTTLRGADHLGKDYDKLRFVVLIIHINKNLSLVKNYLWKTTGQLFR